MAADKEIYPEAHIAGIWDGNLVVASGTPAQNAHWHEVEVLRAISLTEVELVELVEFVELGDVDLIPRSAADDVEDEPDEPAGQQ